MVFGLFSGSSSRRASHSLLGGKVEDQLSDIRDDIATLAKLISKRGSKASSVFGAKAHDARDHAESSLSDIMDGAEDLLADLRHRYSATERQVRHTVREHPLATIGAVAAVGLIVASFLRR